MHRFPSRRQIGRLSKRGVSVMGWVNNLIIAPPLIIGAAEIEEAVAALDAALALADAQVAG